MPTRRELVLSVGGGVVGGGGVYAGMAARSTGYADVEWANERDEEVWVETTLTSTDGLFSAGDVEYESRYRIPPTHRSRSGDSNVVETGTYDVDVEIESSDGSRSAGPFTTRWTPADCYHQRMIIRVSNDMSVEFMQKAC
jgi:hypothetical protein